MCMYPYQLENVSTYKYLGTFISQNATLGNEITHRIVSQQILQLFITQESLENTRSETQH